MSARSPLRLLLFADAELASSMALLRATLDVVSARSDIEVAGIVDAAKRTPSALRLPLALAAGAARRAFNPRTHARIGDRPPLLATCANLARRCRVHLLAPRGGTVNDPDFVEHLRNELRPDAALVLMVGQIFRPPLLSACGTIVNYHDGALPEYRGVGATAWSVYNGEARSGYAYNRLTQGVDQGPILLRGSVEIPPQASAAEVERAKTKRAATRIDDVIEMIVMDAVGDEQRGAAAMFTRADQAAIRAIRDPSAMTWAELQRRLRAFEEVNLELAGKRWEVTGLRRIEGSQRRPLCFVTADGVVAALDRARHLPPAVYLASRSLARRL
jgi:methionyl-tRNA formyltransferase